MTASLPPATILSYAELRDYIHDTLCRRENLLPEQALLQECPLMKNGHSCGAQFVVHGPRALRLTAIWAADLNVVYFYDSRGERFLKVPLRYRLKPSRDAA